MDKNGAEVVVGSYVKVLSLSPKDFGHLDWAELSEVMSMVGETFKVNDVDEFGQAWVRKDWWLSGDLVKSHSVGLRNEELEIQTPDES